MFPSSDTQDIQFSANRHGANKRTSFSATSFNFQDQLSTENM